jgi:phosphohistidine phosphatase
MPLSTTLSPVSQHFRPRTRAPQPANRLRTLRLSVDLILLRHGIAETTSPTGRDMDRRLTPDGIELLRTTLAEASAQGLRPNWIYASPYHRAQQTAAIAAEILACPEPVLTSTRLVPDADPQELWQEFRECAHAAPILFVAHEPLLSTTASWMTGLNVAFQPGSLVTIEFDALGVTPRGILKVS